MREAIIIGTIFTFFACIAMYFAISTLVYVDGFNAGFSAGVEMVKKNRCIFSKSNCGSKKLHGKWRKKSNVITRHAL